MRFSFLSFSTKISISIQLYFDFVLNFDFDSILQQISCWNKFQNVFILNNNFSFQNSQQNSQLQNQSMYGLVLHVEMIYMFQLKFSAWDPDVVL